MDRKQFAQILFKFLTSKQLYGNFLFYRLQRCKKFEDVENFPIRNDDRHLTKDYVESFFVFAFPWNQTSEGTMFWSNISREWKNLLNQIYPIENFSPKILEHIIK